MTLLAGMLAAAMTIFCAGFGATMLLVRRHPTLLETCALTWLFGTGVVSVSLWIGGFFGRGILLQIVVAAVCVSLGALGFRKWRASPSPEQTTRVRKIPDRIFMVLFAVELMLIFWLSLQHTLGWDGLLVWELKARYAFLNGGVLPTAYFADASRWFSHPEYPLLLPLTETWFYLWIGDCDQFWIKLIFPFWYVAAMSILLLVVSESCGKRWLGWIIVLLFPLVPAIYAAPGGIEVGYADLPLAAIYLATIFYLLRFMHTGSRDALALFLALAATLPWMKREGAILWAVISICGGIMIWRQRSLSRAVLSFLPGLGVVMIWKFFLGVVHALPSRDFVSIWPAVFKNFHRASGILHELCLQVIDLGAWDIFWLLVAIALVAVLTRKRTARATTVVCLLLAPLACYCASYVFSAWPNYIAHIEKSLPRLLIQLTPVSWLLIALALAPTERSGEIDKYSASRA